MTVQEQALAAREAAQTLATATRARKDAALHAMADALAKAETAVLEANAADVAPGRGGRHRAPRSSTGSGSPPTGSPAWSTGSATSPGCPTRSATSCGAGRTRTASQVRQVRVPFGVVGIVYEARPNVTADAAGLCLKSGNAVLLRGSSSAAASNAAVVDALRARAGRRRAAGRTPSSSCPGPAR